LNSRVGAKHANSRAELGSTKRDHVLADVLSNNLTMSWVGMSENVLNEIIAVLITCNVDQWNTRAIEATFANTIKIAAEKFGTANLEALLDYLGSKLIHAVLGCIADNMINCATPISRGAVLANVLDAPVAELAVSNNINAGKDLFDARALNRISKLVEEGISHIPYLLQGSFQRCSERPSCQSHQGRLRATYHGEPR
jgi:hypothetical protein